MTPRQACLPTDRQAEVLELIRWHLDSRGYPPTVRELGDALGLRSSATVAQHLEALKQAGLIVWEKGKPRTIRVLEVPRGG